MAMPVPPRVPAIVLTTITQQVRSSVVERSALTREADGSSPSAPASSPLESPPNLLQRAVLTLKGKRRGNRKAK